MTDSNDRIDFAHKGIGAALIHHRMAVPLNQREYSWEREHVEALLKDFNGAISSNKSTYFLGTVVLTKGDGEGGVLEVTDGQQRLATTTILLAAIRDYLFANDQKKRALSIEQEYLQKTDLASEETVPRLQLNVDDNEFFIKTIIADPDSDQRDIDTTKDSHKLLRAAQESAASYIHNILDPLKPGDRVIKLVEWVDFIKNGAQIIVLTVPDHLDAFVMFETLNDRGLRASQADLIKNHLLNKAKKKITEAQHRWATMLGGLESIGLDDIAVTYLRHIVICREGVTRERELFEKVRLKINSQATAMDFLGDLADGAALYAAIFNPDHSFWNPYGSAVSGHVRTLLDLRVEQIRPLMFSVMRKFEIAEARKAFKMFVSWSVRFLIAGGGRGGVLDRSYSKLASDVFAGKTTKASALYKDIENVVPSDAEFEGAFKEARVSQSYLARYYLRALELKKRGEPDPETIPNSDDVINLEHVLPETPDESWKHIDEEQASALCRRLGNMVLLKAKANVALGNGSFAKKRPIYKTSTYLLTKEVGDKSAWGGKEIAARQEKLAKLAVETWPAKP